MSALVSTVFIVCKKTVHLVDGHMLSEAGARLNVRAKRSSIIDGPASTLRQLLRGIDLKAAALASKQE